MKRKIRVGFRFGRSAFSPLHSRSRRPRTSLLVCLLPMVCLAATSTLRAAPIVWLSSFDKAVLEARSSGKLILVNIHTTWCGPCRQLQATTLKDPGLAELIGKYCVPLSLDGDRDSALVERWDVEGYPTQIFLSPNGTVIGKISGYVGPAEYSAALQRAATVAGVDRPRRPEAPAVVAAPPKKQPPVERPAPTRDSQVRPCDATLPLALDGFCPVSMISRAELVPGADNECLVYNGQRYHFVSAKERQMFLRDPIRYLPAADGLCVVTWAEERRQAIGQIKYPAIFSDHVFLFPTEDKRRKFLLDPERYIDSDGRARRYPVASNPPDSEVR